MKATVKQEEGEVWSGLVWSAVKNDFRKNWLIMTEWSSLNNKLLIDARRRPGPGRKCEGFIKLSQYHKQ